MNLKIEKIK